MTRTEYLQIHWSKYPAMPAGAQDYGRIYSLERDRPVGGAFEMVLERAGLNPVQRVRYQFSTAPQNSEHLVEGDLVVVLNPHEILLLAPALQPLPVKKFDAHLQRRWSEFIAAVRDFFQQRNFQEVKTPTLVTCPGTEPSLDVFSTELKLGSRCEKLFLPTSPELHLKKLLTAGAEKIFEMAACFRNGEITERHQPEFLMLEWYRAYAGLEAIKEDVTQLIEFLSKRLKVSAPQNKSNNSVSSLFEKHCDFLLTPQTTQAELQALAKRMGVDIRAAESIDDCFFLIFMEKIESQFAGDELIFVENYPPYQAALARINEQGWGERFELYWKGLELANAFHELNDPDIQRQRMREDLEKKRQMGKEAIPLDEEFLNSLSAGMPPSAGIALGLERLFMAFYDIPQIRDVKLFPR